MEWRGREPRGQFCISKRYGKIFMVDVVMLTLCIKGPSHIRNFVAIQKRCSSLHRCTLSVKIMSSHFGHNPKMFRLSYQYEGLFLETE